MCVRTRAGSGKFHEKGFLNPIRSWVCLGMLQILLLWIPFVGLYFLGNLILDCRIGAEWREEKMRQRKQIVQC